jgi:C-terminal processing protease CtpA/Prc
MASTRSRPAFLRALPRFSSCLLLLGLGPPFLSATAQVAGQGTVTPVLTAAATLAAALPVTSLTPQQVAHLAAFGQVWGFLKYFHPAVAAGQRDWDTEFLRQLPAVLACRSVAERSRLFSAWVTSLGPVAECPTCAALPSQPVRLKPDLRWAQDKQRFSSPLRQQLAFIAANRYQGPPYYVTRLGSSTVFGHEEAYADQPCPTQSLRLLGVCRYWNMLQYYYPYKYLLGDWTQVLPEQLPRFAVADTPLSYRHAAQALFTRVHDGHARYFPPDPLLEAERGAYQVAMSLQFLDNQAVVVGVRHDGQVPASPLEPGDVLTHFAGAAVADLVQQRLPEASGSNRAAQLNTIALNLPYCATPQVAVQVLRDGQPLRLVVPAVRVGTVPPGQPAVADSLYRFLTPEVGYIDMARITRAKLPAIMRAFGHTKGIVVDQRNYPGEFVATQLPAYLLAQPVVFAKATRYDSAYPGRFLWEQPDTLLPAGLPPYSGRVVVLVNEVSRSLAEYTAMALRATPHGLLLGSQTAGADGNSMPITLPGGLKPS